MVGAVMARGEFDESPSSSSSSSSAAAALSSSPSSWSPSPDVSIITESIQALAIINSNLVTFHAIESNEPPPAAAAAAADDAANRDEECVRLFHETLVSGANGSHKAVLWFERIVFANSTILTTLSFFHLCPTI